MQAIARLFTRVAERYLPDAFIFLFFITILVFVLGMFQGSGPVEIVGYWGDGFFDLLEFAMQVTLFVVLGFALANTPPVSRALKALAQLPRNEVQVIVVTVLVMMVCSWISYGFGLVAGAIVAREMGIVHRGRVHYPLIVAASYSGFIVWHAGYSGSVPLLIATEGHFLADEIGVIPVTQTIFSSTTLIILAALVIVVPLALVLMRPRSPEERVDIPEDVVAEAEGQNENVQDRQDPEGTDESPENGSDAAARPPISVRLERVRFVPFILGLLGLSYIAVYIAGGGTLELNIAIFSFLVLGLLLVPNTRHYLDSLSSGARTAYGIILQYPFYAGILGIMSGTGLITTIADLFTSLSSAATLPFWAFISGGIVNLFVPSGGGQWAVQGPVLMEAAQELGAEPAKTAMGLAWGDAWTNLVQPFWTLPLLAIAGLSIRDIMGYTALVLIVSGVVIGGGLLIL
jgi:short-chain fatty acids transporter